MWNQDKYIAAWNFASKAHNGQLVPRTEIPYINHIGLVAQEVMAAIAVGGVENQDLAVLCALLHDTIEDTNTSYNELIELFGGEVANGVAALTKDKSLPAKMVQMTDSLRRIKQQPTEVWMVKLADRITNLQPPPSHWHSGKITKYKLEAEMIYAELGAASPLLAARLAEKISTYQQYC